MTDQTPAAETPGVTLSLDRGVAVLEIRNPAKRNAVSYGMWVAMADHLSGLATMAPGELHAVVVRGHGERAFVSGADLSEFNAARTGSDGPKRYDTAVEAASVALEALPVPTIAMIHGACIGAGFGVAMACDLRYADDRAVFAVPAARLGIGYHATGVRRIVDAIGAAAARELLMTAKRYDATEAKALGMVNAVLPSDGLQAHIDGLLDTLRGNAPLSIRASKQTVRAAIRPEDTAVATAAQIAIAACNDSRDYAEGVLALGERRPPVFTGN
ncbi:enoyl-CoA hydratase-related protein [Tistrella bauzanensis]|uniref:enoyl-CoA hydratase-related protein n=1 Tax=Tistrella TaxID=171436 RepID=UPI0031F6217B